MTNPHTHIPSGYKPSPLGPIPEDWEVKRLGDLCFDIFSGSNKTRIDSGKYTVYGSTGIIGKTDEYKYEGERILVARVGAHAGQVSIASGKYDVSDNTIIVENQDCYSLYFAYQYLIASNLNKLVFGSGQPLITAGMLKRMFVVYPPFEEQLKINNVLQLWDIAIAKQTVLIEQLTLRKRGLMQQLLTGKKRLKGFCGEWKEVRLGEVGKFAGGCAFNEQEQGGQTGIPFYKVSDMNLSGNESKMNIANNYVTHEQIERLGYIVIEDEAIIFAKVGAAIALERKRYAKNFIIDNNMLAYIPSNNVWFMKYWFDSISLSKYIQVGALPSYNASDLSIIKLKMPSLKEQHAIASVLVNADKEIEIQKQKLAAMQEQKKGLMQVLLSGKRRII